MMEVIHFPFRTYRSKRNLDTPSANVSRHQWSGCWLVRLGIKGLYSWQIENKNTVSIVDLILTDFILWILCPRCLTAVSSSLGIS